MARKKLQPPAAPDQHARVDERPRSEELRAADTLTIAEGLAMDQAELYKLVGRIEAAHFMETVSSRLIGEAYLSARAVIRELGEITVRDRGGERKRVSSLEDFCEAVLPVSSRRCRQIAQAMHTLGPELYELAESMRLGARNYAAIRALPLDMQAEVKQAISGGDREQVVQLIEELAARNASLAEKVEDQAKTLAAKDSVIAKKDDKINRLTEQSEKSSLLQERDPLAQFNALIRDAYLNFEHAFLACLEECDQAMNDSRPAVVQQQGRQTVDLMVNRMVHACLERSITVDLAERVSPIFMQEIEEMAASGNKRSGKKR